MFNNIALLNTYKSVKVIIDRLTKSVTTGVVEPRSLFYINTVINIVINTSHLKVNFTSIVDWLIGRHVDMYYYARSTFKRPFNHFTTNTTGT